MDVLDLLRTGLSDTPSDNRPAGIEARQDLAPAAGGPVSPPSYEGDLEVHPRHIDGETRDVLELDSVGSSANRIEEALLAEYHAGRYPLPLSRTTITTGDGQRFEVTTLEAPHRTYDAWLRLSVEPGSDTPFEDSPRGRELSLASPKALDPILEASAHDLLFGVWDSHRSGPSGQVRIARSFVSTVLAFDPLPIRTVAARRDPFNIGEAKDVKPPKGLKLSEQGLSSIPPQRRRERSSASAVSISGAQFIGFLSFASLRRLQFERYDNTDVRILLAALCLYGLLLRESSGWNLRSECDLIPTDDLRIDVVRAGSAEKEPLSLNLDAARELLDATTTRANVADRSLHLEGGPQLTQLVERALAGAAPTKE